MKYVSDVELRLSSVHGTAICMHAGVPRNVPEMFIHDAIAAGAVPIKDEPSVRGQLEATAEVKSGREEQTTEEHILAVVIEIYSRAKASQFTKLGMPKAALVAKLTGFSVTSMQIAEAVQKMPISDKR